MRTSHCSRVVLLVPPLLLLLLLLVLSLPKPVVGTEADCQTSISGAVPPWSGVEWPNASLAHFNRTSFDPLTCTLTFADFVSAHSRWFSCYHTSSINVVTCPQRCLDAVPLSSNAAVYGSFPYHTNSSVCLAAIHAGVIDNAAGGGFFIDRFFPQDWSDGPSQTVFPHGSSLGSLSYGVQSLAVPAEALEVPAPLHSHSWSVRPRGVVAAQRQRAPFSPRSGHVHEWLYAAQQQRANWSTLAPKGWESYRYNLHFIIGGHNDTAYFNDVWLFHSHTLAPWNDTDSLDRHNANNGRWFRLPDAPFTPRAHMQHHLLVYPDEFNMFWGNLYQPADFMALLLLGGETGYACGNRQLGICSSEVWVLNITRSFNASDEGRVDELELSFLWQRGAGGDPHAAPFTVPFAPRCGPTAVFERRGYIYKQNWVTGLVGGQLSYNDTERCAAPVVTTNEAWYGRWPYDMFPWKRGRDAPFSPRRSMVVEDALVSEDDQLKVWMPLDKSATVAGGVRYTGHRWDASRNASVMTGAELYADAWSCTLWPVWESHFTEVDCDWAASFPFAQWQNNASDYAPSGSLPLPIAHSASALFPMGGDLLNMRIGGATSREAQQAWARLSPSPPVYGDGAGTIHGLAEGARWMNVSLVVQPTGYHSRQLRNTGAPTLAEVMASRLHLPAQFSVGEVELNDPTSSFHLGSDVVVTHTMPYLWVQCKQQFSSLGDGLAASSSAVLASSSSSLYGSTRRMFDFRVGRLDHTMASTWNTAIVAGGRSGGTYFNDWITYEPAFCLWPEDPSYAEQLGPVRFRFREDPDWAGHEYYMSAQRSAQHTHCA